MHGKSRVYYQQHKPRLRDELERIFGRGNDDWTDEWANARFKAEEMDGGSGFYRQVSVAAIIENEWVLRHGKKTYFIEDDLSEFLGVTKYDSILSDLIVIPERDGLKQDQTGDANEGEFFCVCQQRKPPVMVNLSKTGMVLHWYGQGKYSAHANGDLEIMFVDVDRNEALDDNWKWWEDAGGVGPTKEILSLVKGVIGFLVYRQAFPEQIFDGFPENMKERCVRHAKNDNVKAMTVRLVEKLRAVPSAHWRNGCFKTLRAERYKRNPDGSPRTIYVNGCVVGKIDPYHANMEIAV